MSSSLTLASSSTEAVALMAAAGVHGGLTQKEITENPLRIPSRGKIAVYKSYDRREKFGPDIDPLMYADFPGQTPEGLSWPVIRADGSWGPAENELSVMQCRLSASRSKRPTSAFGTVRCA